MFVNLVSSFRVNVDNVTGINCFKIFILFFLNFFKIILEIEFDYWNSILAHSLCLFQSQNLYKKKVIQTTHNFFVFKKKNLFFFLSFILPFFAFFRNQIVNKCKNPTLNPKPCLKALLQNGNL